MLVPLGSLHVYISLFDFIVHPLSSYFIYHTDLSIPSLDSAHIVTAYVYAYSMQTLSNEWKAFVTASRAQGTPENLCARPKSHSLESKETHVIMVVGTA